jgi:hypothetical protein
MDRFGDGQEDDQWLLIGSDCCISMFLSILWTFSLFVTIMQLVNYVSYCISPIGHVSCVYVTCNQQSIRHYWISVWSELMYSIFSDVLMLFENGKLSTIDLECYFSLIRTKPCDPYTRHVHNVYTAYTLNEGRTNDYRLAFRATLATVTNL